MWLYRALYGCPTFSSSETASPNFYQQQIAHLFRVTRQPNLPAHLLERVFNYVAHKLSPCDHPTLQLFLERFVRQPKTMSCLPMTCITEYSPNSTHQYPRTAPSNSISNRLVGSPRCAGGFVGERGCACGWGDIGCEFLRNPYGGHATWF